MARRNQIVSANLQVPIKTHLLAIVTQLLTALTGQLDNATGHLTLWQWSDRLVHSKRVTSL
jgi:hypothetical protein